MTPTASRVATAPSPSSSGADARQAFETLVRFVEYGRDEVPAVTVTNHRYPPREAKPYEPLEYRAARTNLDWTHPDLPGLCMLAANKASLSRNQWVMTVITRALSADGAITEQLAAELARPHPRSRRVKPQEAVAAESASRAEPDQPAVDRSKTNLVWAPTVALLCASAASKAKMSRNIWLMHRIAEALQAEGIVTAEAAQGLVVRQPRRRDKAA